MKADSRIEAMQETLADMNRRLNTAIGEIKAQQTQFRVDHQARTEGHDALFARLMDRIAALETAAKAAALPQRLDEHIKQVDQRFKDTYEFNQMRFHGHAMRINELSAKVQAVSYGDELKGIYHRLCDLEDVMRAKGTEAKGRQALEDEAAKQKTQAMLAEHNERCRREMERLQRDIARPTPAYVSSWPQSSPCDFCEGFVIGLLVGGVIVGLVSYFLL